MTLAASIALLGGCPREGELLLEPPSLQDPVRDAGPATPDGSLRTDGGVPAGDAGGVDAGRSDAGPLLPGAGYDCNQPIALRSGVFSPVVPWPDFHSERCNGDWRPHVHFSLEVPPLHSARFYGDPVDVRDRCGGTCPVDFEAIRFNLTDRPRRLLLSAFQWDPRDADAQVMALVTPILAHAVCNEARRLVPGTTTRDQDALNGGPFHGHCTLVEGRGQTLFYLLELRLGAPPFFVRITARPRDRQNLSVSLQAALYEPIDGDCSQRCAEYDDPYFRGTPDATIVVSGAIGSGRDPVQILVAVSLEPSSDPDASTVFDLEVEGL